MTNKALSIFNQLRPVTVGFDNVFDHFERMMDDGWHTLPTASNFPPYNIVKTGNNTYDVELAVAGFKREDLSIEIKDHVLAVKGERSQRRPEEQYIHRGLSTRKFTKSYRLSEYTEVVGADLKDGILSVGLEVIVPEANKPKLIAIK